jgi:hypothetical protein
MAWTSSWTGSSFVVTYVYYSGVLVNSYTVYGYRTPRNTSARLFVFQERSVAIRHLHITSDLLLRLAFSKHIKTGCGAGKTSAVWLQLLVCVAVGALIARDGNTLVFLLGLLLLPPPSCFGRAGLVPFEPRGHGAAGAHRRHPEHGVAGRATATGRH